jgi:hypothetical protein
MAKNKTTETELSVTAFINSVTDEKKRADSFKLAEIMEKTTGFAPRMWGPAIVGFGTYHYKYESGHDGNAPLAAFSPRKDAISLYLAAEPERREQFLAGFGKYKTGKSCIYIKKLDDIEIEVLQKMISHSVQWLKDLYPNS